MVDIAAAAAGGSSDQTPAPVTAPRRRRIWLPRAERSAAARAQPPTQGSAAAGRGPRTPAGEGGGPGSPCIKQTPSGLMNMHLKKIKRAQDTDGNGEDLQLKKKMQVTMGW
ncbi:uncharacterized protein [Tursiops truncatus]|uniref:uncharacterized protein isoform X2 n=1 Tax=Tursiops truncatus TaxID=9739 RepID=UPI003CCF6118